MDLIERVFGVSPDGGSGALEALAFVVALAVMASRLARGRWRRA